jgi:predicted metalloprotease with PDZ domain
MGVVENQASISLRVVDLETGRLIYSGSGQFEIGVQDPPQQIAEKLLINIIDSWLFPGYVGFFHENGLIYKVSPNSPAEQSGLQVGDKIQKVNGREVSGLSSLEINKLLSLRGQAGEELVLEILRAGKRKHFDMVRIDRKKYWDNLNKGVLRR